MKSFLITYDRSTGYVDVESFDDPALALAERIQRELSVPQNVEIVVLSSDSEETIRRTHSRYFAGCEVVAKDESLIQSKISG